MISDFWSCPGLPKPIWFVFGDTRILQTKSSNSPRHLTKTLDFGNLQVSKIHQLEQFGKDARRKSRRSVLTFHENLEYGIDSFQNSWNGHLVIWDQYLSQKHEMEVWQYGVNIYPKTRHGNLVIWDQYLPTSMKCFCIFETLKPRNKKTKKPWNQEAKKL